MIEFIHVKKTYDTVQALKDLHVKIDKGTIYGFVGANGAGKSTAFSILATLIPPTSGDVLVNGKSVLTNAQEVRAFIGYMPDFFGVYDQLKVDEYLDFYGAAYSLPANVRQQKIDQLLALVRLTEKRYEYVDDLSRGMKQRLCLARTLIHDPEVLILDEPASGLDPRARVEMRDILKDLKRLGKTICISSHILPELGEICDEIGVLHEGALIASGTISEIESQLQGEKRITITVVSNVQQAKTFFDSQPNVNHVAVEADEQTITFSFSGQDIDQVNLLKAAVEANIHVMTFEVHRKNLEDAFMSITEEVMRHDESF